MPLSRLTLIPAMLASLLACDETPADPEPELTAPVDSTTAYGVSGSLAPVSEPPDSQFRWEIVAVLRPGLTKDGTARTTNDTLLVNGEPQSPVRIDEGGHRFYAVEILLHADSLSRRVIAVEPPRLDGVELPALSFSGLGRGGGDTLVFEAGANVRLPVEPAATLQFPTPPRIRWGAWLAGEEGSAAAVLSGNALPPPEIVIPGNLVTEGDRLVARFSYTLEGQTPRDASPFLIYRVSGRFGWLVEIHAESPTLLEPPAGVR